ncbi:hypothetical protein EVAR_16470_1 [Eumeta japonica]|uniref:Uncharacterized protein n=1 Tax=Eumeta variegata TaxID=151549 RepID=A0A4C1UKC2_EUMVA|nr:hypothetical protein EVAR_16470_1 [Eumeta japonica]
MLSTRAEPRGACCAQFSERTLRSEPKLLCIKATSVPGSRTRLQHSTPLCSASQKKRIQAQQNIVLQMIMGAGRALLTERTTSPTRTPMNPGTSHRRTRGHRAADPSLEHFSKHLLPKTRHTARAGPHKLDPRKGTIATWIRLRRIPNEKTPVHEATNKSSVPVLCDQGKFVFDPRTNVYA